MKRTSADGSWADLSFWGEVLGLALAAPFFYLSGRLPAWGPLVGLLLIGGTWVWRKRRLGVWFPRTPADWPLLLLILLLPLAVWVAPADLRARYAWPRALILFWNLALFALAATHSRRADRLRVLTAGGLVLLGAGIAAAALFGTHWDTKSPLLTALLERLPRLPTALFGAADEGFSPNQVAGTLLYALPPALAWLAVAVRRRRPLPIVALALACAVMGLVMAATQSRAGLAGLTVALLILLLWPWRWGRRLLGIGAAAILAALIFLPVPDLLTALDDTTKVQGAYGSLSIAGRMEIWARAARALADFPLTGVGLGAFRGVVHQLYPLYLIPPDYDIAHAHNFFLQSGLDLGLLGLAAVLALYLLAGERCWTLDRTPLFDGHRAWSAGLLAALLGQAVYSLADAVALGSKTNLLLWLLLGLIFGLSDSGAFPGRGMRSGGKALVADARPSSADLVPLRETHGFWKPEDRATRRFVLILLLLLTWALGLLLLDAKSLWLDEAYGLYVTRLGLPMLWAGQSEPYHPPLFYWLLERWLRLGGGEFLWRFPSVCFTVVSVLAAYRLACAWFGRAVGLTAATLTAFSPVLIWYAQELRPYALLVLLSLVTTGAITRLCLRPGPVPFLIAAGAITAAVYLHYFALLLLGVHLITFTALLAARRTTSWALPWVAGAWAAAFAAWWPWVQSPAFAAFVRLLTDSGNYVSVLLTQRLNAPPALLGAAPMWLGLGGAAGLALLALLYRLLRLMHERGASARLRRSRVLPYAAGALFALLLVYFVVPRAYTAKRQLLLLVPYLLIAFAWCWPWGKDRRLLGTVAALSLALALVNVVLVPKNQWREAAAYIAAHAQPDDLVLLTPRYMTAPYDLYAPAGLPREGLPFAFDEAALRALEAEHERIWVVFDPFDADPAGRLQQWLSEHGELADTASFYRLDLELYEMGREGS